MAELIASGDTLNTGRIAINNWYSGGTNVWTSGTGSNSVRLSAGNNTAANTFSLTSGKNNTNNGAYGLIINGTGGTVASTSTFGLIGNGKTNSNSGAYGFIGNGLTNILGSGGNKAFIGNGKQNNASQVYTFIGTGRQNTANQQGATVVNGIGNIASGSFAFIGNGTFNSTVAASYNAFIGNGAFNTTTAQFYPTVLNGLSNISAGYYSVVLNGKVNTSSGAYSITHGSTCTASHAFSIAIGKQAISNGTYQMVFANGTGGNSIRLKFLDGSGSFEGGTNLGPADYAEYFEWEDQNPNNEIRYGYAVSLVEEGKVKIGGKNPIGIISSTPAIVGDSAELSWNEKYVTNEWGIKEYEKFKTFYSKELKFKVFIDSDINAYQDLIGGNIQRNSKKLENINIPDGQQFEIISLPKLNPAYSGSEGYVPRSERKEWAPVGLLGKLRVRTKQQIIGKYVDFNEDGFAINGSKYPVLKTIKPFDGTEGIILIFFK